MKIFVINLEKAKDRRQHMERQFEELGLQATFYPAIDGKSLTQAHYEKVDRVARRRLGLYPQADGSIANWLTQREVMQQVVDNGPEAVAIFEDDARLSAELPKVLEELEKRPFRYDVVKLNRRSEKKRFIPCHQLATGHQAGRVRFSDYGSEGYVITREAARHFLEGTPKMIREIDQSISRFWDNGLNVFYLTPPPIAQDEQKDSQIERDRASSRKNQKREISTVEVTWRRIVTGLTREVRRRRAFRQLMRGEIGVTPWSQNSDKSANETSSN